MVVFDKQKYACLSCIRGHRSSSCEHRDRILLQVRRPGRKSLSEPRSRFALVRKEHSPTSGSHCCGKATKASEYKLVRVPSISRPDADVPRPRVKHANGSGTLGDPEDDDVVLTEKYVFVHVGDNLYRRELRPDTLPSRASPAAESQAHTPAAERAERAECADELRDQEHGPPLSLSPVPMPQSGRPMEALNMAMRHAVDPRMQPMPPQMNGSMEQHMNSRRALHVQPNSAHIDPGQSDPAAPLVIAPMSVHNNARNSHNNSDILHELGLTTEEAEQLWPGAFDAGTDLSYASQCVMPGQCECGDDCSCPDCYEHKLKFESMRN